MRPVLSVHSATAPPSPRGGPGPGVRDAVRAELALRYPALDPGSLQGEMAMLLMAAMATGRNVDRLANLTRIKRETVAKFCRRLFDAGIDLAAMDAGHRDFWNVVGLAEGRLARRADGDGGLEWRPVGAVWREGLDGRTDAADRREAGVARAGGPAGAELFPGAEWLR